MMHKALPQRSDEASPGTSASNRETKCFRPASGPVSDSFPPADPYGDGADKRQHLFRMRNSSQKTFARRSAIPRSSVWHPNSQAREPPLCPDTPLRKRPLAGPTARRPSLRATPATSLPYPDPPSPGPLNRLPAPATSTIGEGFSRTASEDRHGYPRNRVGARDGEDERHHTRGRLLYVDARISQSAAIRVTMATRLQRTRTDQGSGHAALLRLRVSALSNTVASKTDTPAPPRSQAPRPSIRADGAPRFGIHTSTKAGIFAPRVGGSQAAPAGGTQGRKTGG